MSRLKGELAAAVAVATGLLLATGYCVTWAALSNEDLPTQAILSALPQSFYIGAAVESLVIPMVILITAGSALLVFWIQSSYPNWIWWSVIGLGFAAYSRLVVALGDPHKLGSWTAETVKLSVAAAAATVIFAAIIGRLGEIVLPENTKPVDRVQIAGAVLLVMAVASTLAFRVVDAASINQVLPYAAVYIDTEDCPPAPDVVYATSHPDASPHGEVRQPPFCEVGGFYLGENGQWVYLARNSTPTLPGRLLIVPREHIRFAAAATKPLNHRQHPEQPGQ